MSSTRFLLHLPLRTPRRIATTTTATTTILKQSISPIGIRLNSSSSSAFRSSPSPPRLPADQQAEFERLQRAVADRFADPTPLPHERQQQQQQQQQSFNTTSTSTSSSNSTTETTEAAAAAADTSTAAVGTVKIDEELPIAPAVWRGAQPEFEGEKNPKTGEIGGPKTEPLRWGSGGDWSYNGRVTDF